MKARQTSPVVGVVADRRRLDHHPFHMAGEKYLTALRDAAGVLPFIVPSLDGADRAEEIAGRLDGLFLTGNPSNVEPARYSGPPSEPGTLHDPERDETALSLITAAVSSGLPLFAVCRGFQEVNVAYGGTLHQKVHEQPAFHVHKENPDDPVAAQYGPSHEVVFSADGLLQSITGRPSAVVNSLHSQGVDRLAEGLVVEAVADDGLIEAFRIEKAGEFALAVQWHPEWQVREDQVSTAIFEAFGDACRRFRAK